MKNFDEWMSENYSGAFDMPHQRDAYEAGQQSKQAEVNKLRERIKKALDHTINHGGYDDLTHIINILKGGENGN